MATNISAYYIDELKKWNHQITLFGQEMDSLTQKLEEVIQRNSIPDIAAKVEHEQDKINALSEKFLRLKKQIQQQVKAFKADGSVKVNSEINEEEETRQDKFRQVMQKIEKEYVDMKYACYNFLSSSLRKQNHK